MATVSQYDKIALYYEVLYAVRKYIHNYIMKNSTAVWSLDGHSDVVRKYCLEKGQFHKFAGTTFHRWKPAPVVSSSPG